MLYTHRVQVNPSPSVFAPEVKYKNTRVLSQVEAWVDKVLGQSDIMDSNKTLGLVLKELTYKTTEINIAGCNLSLKIASVSANVIHFHEVSREHQRNKTLYYAKCCNGE